MNNNSPDGGKSRYQHIMALDSELRSICKNMTFYVSHKAHPTSADEFDPQIIHFNFRIAKNGRHRFHTITSELASLGVSYGFAVREVDSEELKTKWVKQLNGTGLESSSPTWRKEFYNHLRRATKDCKTSVEFTPATGNETAQINLVVILSPGLLDKFEYAIDALATLGAAGTVRIVEQSI